MEALLALRGSSQRTSAPVSPPLRDSRGGPHSTLWQHPARDAAAPVAVAPAWGVPPTPPVDADSGEAGGRCPDPDAHADGAQLAAETLLLAKGCDARSSPVSAGAAARSPVDPATDAPRSRSSLSSLPLRQEQCSGLSDDTQLQLPSSWASFIAAAAHNAEVPPPAPPLYAVPPQRSSLFSALPGGEDACQAVARQVIRPAVLRPVSAAAAARLIKSHLQEARQRRQRAQATAASAQRRQEQLECRRLVAQAQGAQLRRLILEQQALAATMAAMPPPPPRPAAQSGAAQLNLLVAQIVVGLRNALSEATSALQAHAAHQKRQALLRTAAAGWG